MTKRIFEAKSNMDMAIDYYIEVETPPNNSLLTLLGIRKYIDDDIKVNYPDFYKGTAPEEREAIDLSLKKLSREIYNSLYSNTL